MGADPDEEPDHENHGNGEDEGHRPGQHQQKHPILAGVPAGFAQVAAQEQVVAAIRLEGDVEDIAEDGDGAHQHANAEIDGHAHQGDVRNAANPCGDGNDEREQACQHIAEAGYQADDAVNAKADLGAGDAKRFVEQDLDLLEGGVAEEPGAAIPAVLSGGAGVESSACFRCRGG